MNRYVMLLLVGVMTVFILSSCAATKTQKAASVDPGDALFKNMGNGICLQQSNGLMWQVEKSKPMSSWKEADEYVKSLQLAGFGDWRLPTRDECLRLSELISMKKGDCTIKKITKGYWVSNGKTDKSGYWDGDDYPLCGIPEFRWVKSRKGYVRAVRP